MPIIYGPENKNRYKKWHCLALAVCNSITARHRAVIDMDTGYGGCTLRQGNSKVLRIS